MTDPDEMAEFFDQWPPAPAEAGAANVTLRTCAWCETPHPEHVSISWVHGERLYFCTDTCHREWCEHG